MFGQQHRAKDFAALGQVVEVGAAIFGAGIAGAARVERRGIFSVACITQVDRAGPGEALPIAARAAGQDAVEHVDPALHRANQIVGLAHPP